MAQANDNRQLLRTALALKIEQGADAAEVAAVVTRALGAMAAKLSPIVGKAGVVALYKRSIHLASPAYPWLSSSGDARDEIDLAALGSSLAGQGAAGAAEAGAAVVETFRDLLGSLVGIDLTHRLLHSVWTDL